MVFLTAQPDEPYFYWQLEIQVLNLHNLGICSRDIHIVVGYDEEKGLSECFHELSKQNTATLFAYPDTRRSKAYVSSIRPHLLYKHFGAINPDGITFFYLDSDVIFREIPDIKIVTGTGMLFSPAPYISVDEIILRYEEAVFLRMCAIVKVDPAAIRADGNTGGVQYVFKNVPVCFWRKAEEDAELLYRLLRRVECAELLKPGDEIQRKRLSWCADLWAVWWNLVYFNIAYAVHPDLDFCWAHSPAGKWDEKKILHYTGSLYKRNHELFDKTKYMDLHPFSDDFRLVNPAYCSYRVVEIIDQLVRLKPETRLSAADITVFLYSERGDNVMTDLTLRYYRARMNPELVVIEEYSMGGYLPAGRHNTPFVGFIPAGCIIPSGQLAEALAALRSGNYLVAYPHNGAVFGVENVIMRKFTRCPDERLLLLNRGKLEERADPCILSSCFFCVNDYNTRKQLKESKSFQAGGPLFTLNATKYEPGII